MNKAIKEEDANAPTDFRSRLAGFAYANDVPSPNNPGGEAAPEPKKGSPGTFGRRRAAVERSTRSYVASGPSAAQARKITARRAVPEGKKKAATPSPKKRTSTKERSANDVHSPQNNLVDSLRPGLTLVMIGLNPGLETARTGHAYAHPSNSFWKLLHAGGITSKQHLPAETHDLQDLYGIGNTNICARPTRSGDGLTKEEMVEGASILETKIQQMKPAAVGIVGKSIWETLWQARTGKKQRKDEFSYGWQKEETWLGRTVSEDGKVIWEGARTYVLCSTSGLNAYLKPPEKLAIWKPLGEWFAERRMEIGTVKEEGTETKD